MTPLADTRGLTAELDGTLAELETDLRSLARARCHQVESAGLFEQSLGAAADGLRTEVADTPSD
jgi:hypothetical protein